MTENLPEEPISEESSADELEQQLLDAMRSLSRKSRKVEEYLDGLARATEKPQQEKTEPPPA
jgi:hypothetical protein